MSDRLTRVLKLIAFGLGALVIGWAVYDTFLEGSAPGDSEYHAANTLFEDGHYERAIAAYRRALGENPDHLFALRGLARALHKAERPDEALTVYDEAIARAEGASDDDQQTALAASYANRGILKDTMGRHEEALADYEHALALDPEIASGPNWLTRFLRNQAEAPPTVADRARYLRAEFAKPEDERLLRLPEVDAAQRPYQQ